MYSRDSQRGDTIPACNHEVRRGRKRQNRDHANRPDQYFTSPACDPTLRPWRSLGRYPIPTRLRAQMPDRMQSENAAQDSFPGSDAPRAAGLEGCSCTSCEIAGGSSFRMAVIVSAEVERWKARVPVSIS